MNPLESEIKKMEDNLSKIILKKEYEEKLENERRSQMYWRISE